MYSGCPVLFQVFGASCGNSHPSGCTRLGVTARRDLFASRRSDSLGSVSLRELHGTFGDRLLDVADVSGEAATESP